LLQIPKNIELVEDNIGSRHGERQEIGEIAATEIEPRNFDVTCGSNPVWLVV